MIQTNVNDFLDEFLTGSGIESQTLNDFSRKLDIAVRGWALVWKFNTQIDSESQKREPVDMWIAVTMILIQKMIFSSKAYLMLFLNGFYHNANILLRSMFETAGLLSYIWKNHEAADSWVDDGKVSISTYKLFNELFDIEGRSQDVGKLYQMLCDDVHSNANKIIEQFYIPGEEKTTLTLKNIPIYDKKIADGKFDYFLAFILLRRLIINCESILDEEHKNEIENYIEDFMKMHKEERKEKMEL